MYERACGQRSPKNPMSNNDRHDFFDCNPGGTSYIYVMSIF